MIAVGCDHAGLELKERLKTALQKEGEEFFDYGCYSSESVDYPDFAKPVALEVYNGARGLLICGSGVGMSIAANKFRFVRAALCRSAEDARLSREHNDSNILVLGARATAPEDAEKILHTWLYTPFAGGRHAARIEKIKRIEEENRRTRGGKEEDGTPGKRG